MRGGKAVAILKISTLCVSISLSIKYNIDILDQIYLFVKLRKAHLLNKNEITPLRNNLFRKADEVVPISLLGTTSFGKEAA